MAWATYESASIARLISSKSMSGATKSRVFSIPASVLGLTVGTPMIRDTPVLPARGASVVGTGGALGRISLSKRSQSPRERQLLSVKDDPAEDDLIALGEPVHTVDTGTVGLFQVHVTLGLKRPVHEAVQGATARPKGAGRKDKLGLSLARHLNFLHVTVERAEVRPAVCDVGGNDRAGSWSDLNLVQDESVGRNLRSNRSIRRRSRDDGEHRRDSS